VHVADTYLGHRTEDAIAARLEEEGYETIRVGEDERRRSRFRTTAEAGTAVGVTVARELETGDVLAAEDRLFVVELRAIEAMTIDLSGATGSLTAAIELGHAMGNRHWDLAVRGDTVSVPVTDSRARMRETVDPLVPDGATIDYERVSPAVFDDGGHVDHDHAHDHDEQGGHGSADHGHAHEHDATHDHASPAGEEGDP